MLDSKPVSTPVAPRVRLVKTTGSDHGDLNQKLYQRMVGCDVVHALRFGVRHPTALTIQFKSNKCASPSGETSPAILQGSQTTGLICKRNGKVTVPIQAYYDADYAADGDRKSISGYLFLLAGAAISWQAKNQTMVAQSTVEGEYAAMAHAAKELIWLQNLLWVGSWNVKICADNPLLRQSRRDFTCEESHTSRENKARRCSTPLSQGSCQQGDNQC